jgi:hypothetical protein
VQSQATTFLLILSRRSTPTKLYLTASCSRGTRTITPVELVQDQTKQERREPSQAPLWFRTKCRSSRGHPFRVIKAQALLKSLGTGSWNALLLVLVISWVELSQNLGKRSQRDPLLYINTSSGRKRPIEKTFRKILLLEFQFNQGKLFKALQAMSLVSFKRIQT